MIAFDIKHDPRLGLILESCKASWLALHSTAPIEAVRAIAMIVAGFMGGFGSSIGETMDVAEEYEHAAKANVPLTMP